MVNRASTMLKILKILDKSLKIVEGVILIFCGIIIIGALLYSAIVRYFLRGSFPEAPELTWFMYTWMVFLGSSAVLGSGDHPLVSIFRGKRGKLYNIVIYVLCVLYIAVLLYALYIMPRILWMQKTIVLQIPYIYFYAAMVIGFSFMIIRYIIKIIMINVS